MGQKEVWDFLKSDTTKYYSLKDISIELRCSYASVANAIKKLMKFYSDFLEIKWEKSAPNKARMYVKLRKDLLDQL